MARSPEDQIILSAFGAGVRKARKAHGWTQQALGERAGIEGDQVGCIERGKKSPGVAIVYRLILALGESFQNLMNSPETHETSM